MHKAMLETLYLFGVRKGELLGLRIKNVTYGDGLCRITVTESKTQVRTVPYDGRPNYLMAWVEEQHPFKDNPDAPVFICQKGKKIGRQMNITGPNKILGYTCNRAGLRHIKIHDFRHTAITRDMGDTRLTTSLVETKFGLRHGSGVIQIYDHNDTKNLEEALTQKIETAPETYEQLKKDNETIVEALQQKIEVMMKQLDWQHDIMKKAGLIKPTH